MGDVIFDIEAHLKMNKNLTNEDAIVSIVKCRNIHEDKVPPVEVDDGCALSFICEHRWNMGFRKKLAEVIARNFRCKHQIISGNVFMSGSEIDAKIAVLVFNYAYSFALMSGNRCYNKAYSFGRPTKGVFNEYIDTFIDSLVHSLEDK